MVRSLIWQKFRPLGPVAKATVNRRSVWRCQRFHRLCSHKMWMKMPLLLTNTATKQRQKGKLEFVVRLKFQLIG